MPGLNQFVVKDAVTIREDILRVIKNGLIRQNVTNPNVNPGTDWYIIATALGNELTTGAGVSPPLVATTASSSCGSSGFGTWLLKPARSACVRSCARA